MALPITSPLLQLDDFDYKAQQSASGNLQSTHTVSHGLVTAGDCLSGVSMKPGRRKLFGRREPMVTSPVRIPTMHGVETPRGRLEAAHCRTRPPFSVSSTHASPTVRRKPAIRRQTTVRKRNVRGNLADEEIAMIETLPKPMRRFFEKERLWSNTQADSDYMLRPPRPKHRYVDEKQRFTCDDLRFIVYKKLEKGAACVPLAGIPSERPYTPYHKAASPCIWPAALGSPLYPAFVQTANEAPQEEAFHTRPSIKLIIPDVIKALLVDDWENVTKNTQLVPLPHPKPVTKILEDYSAYEMPNRLPGSSHADILEETLSGLREYFDKSLGRILLYKFERPQYAEVHKKWNSSDPEFQGKTASDVYGAEHLCRLIVSLPELIAQTNMDQQSVNRLREELAKFSTWLSKKTTDYFVSSYETPAQDYVDRAKN